MKLQITIDLDNAAFNEPNSAREQEAARILNDLAHIALMDVDRLDMKIIRDINGNRVGLASLLRDSND